MTRSEISTSHGLHAWFESKKRGFRWKHILSGSGFCIYEQISLMENRVVAYEVWRIRFRPERIIEGRSLSASMRFPSDEDFGKHAWTRRTLDGAVELFIRKAIS